MVMTTLWQQRQLVPMAFFLCFARHHFIRETKLLPNA